MSHRKGSCGVCAHKDRSAIEEALLRSEPVRQIGDRYGLAKSSVFTHGKRHLTRSDERAAAISHEALIERLERLELDARRLLSKAERGGDYRSAILAVREMRGLVDTLARIVGAIRTTTEVSVVNVALGSMPDDVIRKCSASCSGIAVARRSTGTRKTAGGGSVNGRTVAVRRGSSRRVSSAPGVAPAWSRGREASVWVLRAG